MNAPSSQPAIEHARALWAAGTMIKEIERQTGLSTRTVRRVCSDVARPPVEHRGRRSNPRFATRLADDVAGDWLRGEA